MLTRRAHFYMSKNCFHKCMQLSPFIPRLVDLVLNYPNKLLNYQLDLGVGPGCFAVLVGGLNEA